MGSCFEGCFSDKLLDSKIHTNSIDSNKHKKELIATGIDEKKTDAEDEEKQINLKKLPIIILGDSYYDDVKNYITSKWQDTYKNKRDLYKSRTASYFLRYAKHPIFFDKLIKKKSECKDNSIVPEVYMQQNKKYYLAEVIRNSISYNENEFLEIMKEIMKIPSFKWQNIEMVIDSWIRAFFLDALDEYIKQKLKKRPLYYKKDTTKFPPLFILFIDEKDISIERKTGKENVKKSWNIIYYNNQKIKNLPELYKEFETVEEKILSKCDCNFFCCDNMVYFELLMRQIIIENEKKYNNELKIKYSLILNDENAKEILDYSKEKNYFKYFNKILILSEDRENTEKELSTFLTIINEIFDKSDFSSIIDFFTNSAIDTFSIEIDELITSSKFQNKYNQYYEKIKKFNGKYSKEEFEIHYKEFKNFITLQSNEKLSGTGSKIGSLEKMATEALVDSMKIFGNFELENTKRSIQLIKEYYSPQNDALLRYLNYWLRELDNNTYDKIAYFISDIIYSLNSFGNARNKIIEGVHTWYRGLAIPFSDLLLYKQNEGDIIIYPSFTSSTNILNIAEFFSKKEKEKRKNELFSVIIIIKYNCAKTDIPVSIDINELTRDNTDVDDNTELRILLPFTFYKIKNVIIDEIKEMGEIELEVIAEKKENNDFLFLPKLQKSSNNKNKTLIYLINDIENETLIFGEEFVEKNKNNLKLKINGKIIDLCSKYIFNNYGEVIVEIIEQKPITNMQKMFYECENLLSLSDLSSWDMKNITDTSNMFSFCSRIENISFLNNWNMKNVTNTSGMFTGCTSINSIDSLKNWNMENVYDTSYMFAFMPIKSLQSLKNWNISNVINAQAMFKNCSEIENLDPLKNWKWENIINMSEMFSGCSKIKSIESLKNWNMSNVNDVSEMFCKCVNLCSINCLENWDTKNIIDSRNMFRGCKSLTIVDALKNWNINNAAYTNGMFYNCSSIKRKVTFNGMNINDEDDKNMY